MHQRIVHNSTQRMLSHDNAAAGEKQIQLASAMVSFSQENILTMGDETVFQNIKQLAKPSRWPLPVILGGGFNPFEKY